MIPQFTEQGLLPAGLHDCDLAAVSLVFCGNAHRSELFENLQKCLAHMRSSNLQGIVVINGSFVTDKEVPADIELTLDTRALPDADQLRAFKYFQTMHYAAKEQWKVDWYPTIGGIGQNDFVSFFQYAGVKTAAVKGISAHAPKGILRLSAW